jgi:hypothetical protein
VGSVTFQPNEINGLTTEFLGSIAPAKGVLQ